MGSVLSEEPLAVVYTPDNLIIWITWNFWETKVISMTWSENYFCGQVLGVDRMVWGGFLSSCSFKKSLWLQGNLNFKIFLVLAAVSWLCVFSFQMENLHRNFSLNTEFELKVELLFGISLFVFFKCQKYLWNVVSCWLSPMIFIYNTPMVSEISLEVVHQCHKQKK